MDIAVDPVDGTTLLANDMPNAIVVIAAPVMLQASRALHAGAFHPLTRKAMI